jgi:8-oxo-dGTP diphosphatase
MNEPCYYRVSVKGIVVDETGRLLLSREEDGKWDTLGGGLDHGEDPIVGLRREIFEETGLEVTSVSSSPKYFITAQRFGGNTFVANVVYEIKLKSLEFTPSDECQELRFCTLDEARQLDLLPNPRKLLDVYDPALHV